MLPFMKHSKEASVAVNTESVKRKPDEEPEYDPIHSAAEDLHSALKSGDIPAIAEALRSAFIILDSEPHHEGPYIEEQ